MASSPASSNISSNTHGSRSIHTEVSADFQGRGVASALARFALDDARRRDMRVIVNCPYVEEYVTRHPDDDDIIVGRTPATPT